MLGLQRTAFYMILTSVAALALFYPLVLPDTYIFTPLADAPVRTKVAFGLLAGLGLLIPRVVARMGFAHVARLVDRWHGAIHRALRIQRLEMVSAERVRQALMVLHRGAQQGVTLLLWGIFATRVLTLFPGAQPIANEIRLMVVGPLQAITAATVDYLPNAVQIAVILVITRYLLKVIHLFFHAVGAEIIVLPDFYPEWAEPTYKITRMLVFVFVPFLIVPLLPGANSKFFDNMTFFIGLLVSLGSTSAIRNMTSGIVLTYTRSFQLGDRVKIGEVTGDVVEKSLFVTRIQTIKNEQVALPNGAVLESNIINYSALAQSKGLILHSSVTIGYDVDWRQVHRLLIEGALATPHIQAEPKPFVLQTSLDDYYVEYEINAYTDQPNRIQGTLSALHQNILDSFHTAGVEIMSPAYNALRNGNSPAIPPLPGRQQIGAPPRNEPFRGYDPSPLPRDPDAPDGEPPPVGGCVPHRAKRLYAWRAGQIMRKAVVEPDRR